MISKEHIQERFKTLFSDEALIVRSPGRINIIGEHTDYNEGFVLPAAIDKAVYIAVSKRSDQRIVLYSESYAAYFETTLDNVAITDVHWPNYILGVVDQLIEAGYCLGGFNLYIDGDIPLGAGLSSSAAVECASILALSTLFQLNIARIAIPKIGQRAEHKFAKVMCGIMDQFASTFGKKDYVFKLDCRTLDYNYVPLELGNYSLVLLNSNVKHSLGDTAYNTRRQQCEQAVAWIQEKYPSVKSLRDVALTQLNELVKYRDITIYTKARYVIEENARVEAVCENLSLGKIKEVGKLLYETHDGLSKDYEVSCPEIDFLVDATRDMQQVIGARMMGGGFGGCTLNLVETNYVDELIEKLSQRYKEAFGLMLTPIKVQTADGTSVL